MIASLWWAGLSQRSIAAATGSSRDTIRTVTQRQVDPAGPPPDRDDDAPQGRLAGPPTVIGADGRRYPAAPSAPQKPEPESRVVQLRHDGKGDGGPPSKTLEDVLVPGQSEAPRKIDVVEGQQAGRPAEGRSWHPPWPPRPLLPATAPSRR